MEKIGDTSPLIVPPALVAEIESVAVAEQRASIDVLQDAVTSYVRMRRWQRTLAFGKAHAAAHGFTEADVGRLIAEAREESRHGH
jgi:predicted transcriptional regulator